ncbi:MFS general substrate transporter [Pleurostoma richardsiae]|uniref:MFS general substrate transporter n=1 Tax=Pleurostoma richardsiae TaxID=41990 RepID=A0AA38RS01_9PEZI|nr:MFS general substrate transporter [Pleurostoma richardsiae]
MQSFLQYRRLKLAAQQPKHDHGAHETGFTSPHQPPPATESETGESTQDDEDATPNHAGPIVIQFDGPDDPSNPQNFSSFRKAIALLAISLIAFIVGFGSSVDAPLIPRVARHFGVSEVAESLATALYLVGFGCGAPFAGPLSEKFGRSPVYVVTLALFAIFIMAAGLSPNFGAQLTFRFLAGFFGSTPFTTAGGTLADLLNPQQRGKIFPFFALIAFLGPMIGPVVGGYIAQNGSISWRWTEWITLIVTGAILVIVVLFLPETSGSIILGWKASALRGQTGDPRYQAPGAATAEPLTRKLLTVLYRPFLIFFSEPIVILFTLYLTLVYMVAFSFFSGFAYIYGQTYQFSEGSTYLMFLGIVVGLCLVPLLGPLVHRFMDREAAKAKEKGFSHPPPESKLWFSMICAPLLPISLYWMGWSAKHSVSYWSPLVGSALFGMNLLATFISTYGYLIDTFERFAASALVAITFIRYCAGGAMVVVAIPMFENLGVAHAMTVLASISVLIATIPYVFYIWGHRIRAMSRLAPNKM